MKLDFFGSSQPVYPQRFYDIYADVTDILYIGTHERAYNFIQADLIEDMRDAIRHLLFYLKPDTLNEIDDMIGVILEKIRRHHECIFYATGADLATVGIGTDNDHMRKIAESIQLAMPNLCAYIAELSAWADEKPIKKSDCAPAPLI